MDRMMGRAVIGAVAGAIVMFILGFVFYATPLQKVATASLDDRQAAAVQTTLAASMPRTGTYFLPDPTQSQSQATMYSLGPIATIHYNMKGFAIGSTKTMIAGFIQMLIVSLLLAAALYYVVRHVAAFGDQLKILLFTVLSATIFIRLGTPIWYHYDWPHAIYSFIADSLSLGVAGLIMLKLMPHRAAAAPSATTES